MNDLPAFNETHAEFLIGFLDDPRRPEGTMHYEQVAGFIFAMACIREVIPPSEWLPLVFNDGDPAFASDSEAEACLGALLALYTRIIDEMNGGAFTFPPKCAPLAEPAANFAPDASLSRWANGFWDGYEWLQEWWPEELPEDAESHLGTVLLVLTFFTSREVAAEYLEDLGRTSDSPDVIAAEMIPLLPEAMRDYADLAAEFAVAGEPEPESLLVEKIGRNDPCPCGSGMKFKKCCGKGSASAV